MYSLQQAIYFKNYLTLKDQGNNLTRLNSSLYESKITLNPHQINAALTFFKNPLNKGFIFADEVGLGKTIEAGLIISQYWYERKRKILIICPASLIKQWNEELYNKFHLNSIILDSKDFKNINFQWEENIYITSLHSIYLNKKFFNYIFDLIVIDEAHKLRNVYKDSGVMASSIKETFTGQKKLLLTATPFQNNLMELFGLMSLLDENIFPDEKLFREKYIRNYYIYKDELYKILKDYIVRTLRKDVSKYVKYTQRNVILADYYTTAEEQKFYNLVSNVMYSDNFSNTYKQGQNQLIIILLQKLLSSSIYAVTSTLNKMKNNLLQKECFTMNNYTLDDDILINISPEDIESKDELISKIDDAINFSNKLTKDSKLKCLIDSINKIYKLCDEDTVRNKKILIFTESKKTQEYLFSELTRNGFNSVLTFNGDNNSSEINKLYQNWLSKNNITRSSNKTANIRRAIIDAFENSYDILIATDSAAEGLNMQFCSILINYDLPWNPQKIEQRIGRCHRYGQKNDVIVVNLLNRTSSIDQRIYELLNTKLGIFESTFGSSDIILGNDNIAKNIEDAIRDVYKKCRNPEDIETYFIELQKEFSKEIEETIKKSESEMLTYFDEEVQKNFDLQYIKANNAISEYQEILCKLIEFVYPSVKITDNLNFELNGSNYTLEKNNSDKIFVSLNSDFGQNLLSVVNNNSNSDVRLSFHYNNYQNKIGFIDNLTSSSGKIIVSKVIYSSFEETEALVLTGLMDDNTILPTDIIHKLLKLHSTTNTKNSNLDNNEELYRLHEKDVSNKLEEIEKYNNEIFESESNYIDNWADSMIEKIQYKVKEMRLTRKELQLQFDLSSNIDEKRILQEKISKLSKTITKSWIELAEAEDEVNDRRNILISNLYAEKNKTITCDKLFEMRFDIL